MNKIKISKTDLASRSTAGQLRLQLLQILSTNSTLELDLSSVESISDSYADELFGVLSASIGLENFFSRVKIVGARQDLARVIAQNIRNRTTELAA